MKKSYLSFWKSLGYVLLMSMAFCIMPGTVLGQGNTNVFIEVDLMKVKPGDDGKYVELEKNVWKPIHQERIKKGIIVGWVLYRVMYTGTDDKYNYATVNVYANPANLEHPYQGIDFTKIHPGKDINVEFEKTMKARKLVRSQVLSRVNYAYPGGGENSAPHNYIVVNYMKSIPGGDFLQVENELSKPTAEELVKSGEWAGWSVWSNFMPRGTSFESDYVTVDYYPNFSNLGSANYMQAFQKANPGKDWAEFIEKAGKSRNMVRTELWKIVDSAFAEQ